MYTSVMSTAHPQAVPELLAYLIFILRASQDFGGVAWVTYDAAFRQQASIMGNQHVQVLSLSSYDSPQLPTTLCINQPTKNEADK